MNTVTVRSSVSYQDESSWQTLTISFSGGITGKHVWDTHFAAVGNVCMQLAQELEQLPALSGVLDHSDLFTEWRTSTNLLADKLWSRLDQQTFVSGREYFLPPGHQRYVPNRRSEDKGHYVNVKTGVPNSELDHRLASLRQRFQDQVDERLDTCMTQLKELYLIYEKHLHAAGDNHVPPPRTSYVDPEHSLQPKPRVSLCAYTWLARSLTSFYRDGSTFVNSGSRPSASLSSGHLKASMRHHIPCQ
jgi:hypothetical protein